MSLASSNIKPAAPQNEFAGKWPVFRTVGKRLMTAKAILFVQKLCNETKGQPEAEQPHTQALGDFNVFQWLICCRGAGSKSPPRPFKSFSGLSESRLPSAKSVRRLFWRGCWASTYHLGASWCLRFGNCMMIWGICWRICGSLRTVPFPWAGLLEVRASSLTAGRIYGSRRPVLIRNLQEP